MYVTDCNRLYLNYNHHASKLHRCFDWFAGSLVQRLVGTNKPLIRRNMKSGLVCMGWIKANEHWNTGLILFSPYRLVLTSYFILLEVCLSRPIAAQVKVTNDESMLLLALPEPIETALQCLQFEKNYICMEVYGNTQGDSQSDRNRPKRDGTTHNVTLRWLDYISRGRTNSLEEWKLA